MAHQIVVPPLGQTTDTVVLSTWYKHVGDTVKSGEPLFAIETDKATLDIEAQADGTLAEVSAADGEEVPVLSIIGTIAGPREGTSARVSLTVGSSNSVKAVAAPQPLAQTESQYLADVIKSERIFISPRARRLAEVEHVDWRTVTGTGPLGAIVERDVRQVLSGLQISLAQNRLHEKPEVQVGPGSLASVSTVAGEYERREGHLAREVDASAIIELRQRLVNRGVAVTHECILLYILARVMRHTPQFDAERVGLQFSVVTIDNDEFVIKRVSHPETMSLTQLNRVLSEQLHTGLSSYTDSASQLLFLNLAEYNLDVSSPVTPSASIPTLAVGRVRHTKSGDALMWLNFEYDVDRLKPAAAMRLMQTYAQLIEDPDLLL